MKQRPRIYYSAAQKTVMWEHWKQGESLHQIAQLFDRGHSAIQRILAESGGIQPAQRCRSARALTLVEREEISRSLAAGHAIRTIAALLGRAPSTISREISRNGGQNSYRASCADAAAWDRAHRPKNCKLVDNPTLARAVADNSKCNGHQNKLRVGLSMPIPGTRPIRCHTRPFIAASTFRRAAL